MPSTAWRSGFQGNAFQDAPPDSEGFQRSAFQEKEQAFQTRIATGAFQESAFFERSFQAAVQAFENVSYQGDAFQGSDWFNYLRGVGAIPAAEAFGTPNSRFRVTSSGISTAESFSQPILRRVVRTRGILQSRVVLDDFERADETPIGGNWSALFAGTGLNLTSRQLRSTASGRRSYWNAANFGPNVDVYATYTGSGTLDGSSAACLVARAQNPSLSDATAVSYKVIYNGSSQTFVVIRTTGADTNSATLGTSGAIAVANGDTVRFRVTGTATVLCEVYINDVLVFSATDSSASRITSAGAVGARIDSTYWRLDDFGAETVSGPSVRFVISPTGVSTSEGFGVTTVSFASTIPQVTGVGAITTGEAFGKTIVRFMVEPVGLSSLESFGTTTSRRIVANAGAISSQQALGSPQTRRILAPVGLSSLEGFGIASLIRTLRNAGAIASAEAFGATRLLFLLRPGGIAGAEALGQPKARFIVYPLGIASAEAFGTTRLLSPQWIWVTPGISSAEAFGSDSVQRILRNAGAISSAEAVSQPKLRRLLAALGIQSAEALSEPKLLRRIGPLGITSAETFGVTLVRFGLYTISAVGAIPSAEAFGDSDKVIRLLRNSGAISSAQAFGTTDAMRIVRSSAGITSAEAFGQSAKLRRLLYPLGATSAENFGLTYLKSPQWVTGVGAISSAEAFGASDLIRVIRQAGGIASLESLGQPKLLRQLVAQGIVSSTALGTPKLVRFVLPIGIVSDQAIGILLVSGGVFPSVPASVFLSDVVLVEVVQNDNPVYETLVADLISGGEVVVLDASTFAGALSDRTLTELLLNDSEELS